MLEKYLAELRIHKELYSIPVSKLKAHLVALQELHTTEVVMVFERVQNLVKNSSKILAKSISSANKGLNTKTFLAISYTTPEK